MPTGLYIRRAGLWFPLTSMAPPLPLPAGPGIIPYATALANGATDVQSAFAYAATLNTPKATLVTFPTGTYNVPFNFSSNSAPVLTPPGIGWAGQGPLYTKFVGVGPLNITGIPRVVNTTNPYYLIRTTGLGVPITSGGFSIDVSGLAALAVSYNAATNYAINALVKSGINIFRSLQPNNLGHAPVGGTTGDAWWETICFGGIMYHQEANLTNHDIVVKGVYGYSNVPPGEIFNINYYKPTGTLTYSNIEADGGGIGACGIGYNSNNTDCYYLGNNIYTHDMAHSHGSSFYQCKDADIYNHLSMNNGTGIAGSSGAGSNNEETYGTIIYHSPVWGNNSLVGMRVEAGDNGGVNNPNFQVINPSIFGSKYGIWAAPTSISHGSLQIQTSLPLITGGSVAGTTSPTRVGSY